jgi:hypothetical protein
MKLLEENNLLRKENDLLLEKLTKMEASMKASEETVNARLDLFQAELTKLKPVVMNKQVSKEKKVYSKASIGPKTYANAAKQAKPVQQKKEPVKSHGLTPMTEEELSRAIYKPRQKAEFQALYFSGLRRMDTTSVKKLLLLIGVNLNTVRNISYIGTNIIELIVFKDASDVVISAFKKRDHFNHLVDFDPLATDNLKGPKFTGLSKEELSKRAKEACEKRTKTILDRLPSDRRFNNLRSFISGISKGSNTVC